MEIAIQLSFKIRVRMPHEKRKAYFYGTRFIKNAADNRVSFILNSVQIDVLH